MGRGDFTNYFELLAVIVLEWDRFGHIFLLFWLHFVVESIFEFLLHQKL
jgi:hypothetical protein